MMNMNNEMDPKFHINRQKALVVEREKRWRDMASWELTRGNRDKIPESTEVRNRVMELKMLSDHGEGSLDEWEDTVFSNWADTKHRPAPLKFSSTEFPLGQG